MELYRATLHDMKEWQDGGKIEGGHSICAARLSFADLNTFAGLLLFKKALK